MNLFNCFQAVLFYSLLPFLIMWADKAGHKWLAVTAGIGMFVGYVILSFAVNSAAGRW